MQRWDAAYLTDPSSTSSATMLIQTHAPKDATALSGLSHCTSNSNQEEVPLVNMPTDQSNGGNSSGEVPPSWMCH